MTFQNKNMGGFRELDANEIEVVSGGYYNEDPVPGGGELGNVFPNNNAALLASFGIYDNQDSNNVDGFGDGGDNIIVVIGNATTESQSDLALGSFYTGILQEDGTLQISLCEGISLAAGVLAWHVAYVGGGLIVTGIGAPVGAGAGGVAAGLAGVSLVFGALGSLDIC